MEHGDPKASPITAHDESAMETEENEVSLHNLVSRMNSAAIALLIMRTSVLSNRLKWHCCGLQTGRKGQWNRELYHNPGRRPAEVRRGPHKLHGSLHPRQIVTEPQGRCYSGTDVWRMVSGGGGPR